MSPTFPWKSYLSIAGGNDYEAFKIWLQDNGIDVAQKPGELYRLLYCHAHTPAKEPIPITEKNDWKPFEGVPVTDGIGGPEVGNVSNVKVDMGGNLKADMTIDSEAMANKIIEEMKPAVDKSISEVMRKHQMEKKVALQQALLPVFTKVVEEEVAKAKANGTIPQNFEAPMVTLHRRDLICEGDEPVTVVEWGRINYDTIIRHEKAFELKPEYDVDPNDIEDNITVSEVNEDKEDEVLLSDMSAEECLERAQEHADAAYDYDPDAMHNVRNALDYLIELQRRAWMTASVVKPDVVVPGGIPHNSPCPSKSWAHEECEDCDGRGLVDSHAYGKTTCARCGGMGSVRVYK